MFTNSIKYGNVSHTIVKLPELFKNRYQNCNIDIFSIPKRHQYFRFSDLINKTKCYNYNNNFVKSKLKFKSSPRLNFSFLPQSSQLNQSQTFTNQTNLNNSTPEFTKESFNKQLEKTVDGLLERIKLNKDQYLITAKTSLPKTKKAFTSGEGFERKSKLTNIYDKDERYQIILDKKVMSLRCVSQKVKEQYLSRHLCVETAKNFHKIYNSPSDFKNTIHESIINCKESCNNFRNKNYESVLSFTKHRNKSM